MAVDLEYYGVPPADFVQLSNRTRLTAASGQTTFPAPYTVGNVDVYYNGAKLDPYTEFTATDGANVILTTAASATGDIVEVISQAQVALANTYTQQQVNNLVGMYYGICTGTGDAQVLVTTPTFTAYSDGMMVRCRAIAANTTTTPTIAVNGLVATTIVSNNGQGALYGFDFAANSELTLRYVQAVNKFVLVDGATTQQTPAQLDSTHQLATTAFVQRALGNFQTSIALSAGSYTLTNADLGKYFTFQDTSNTLSVTLPAATSSIVGATVTFKVTSSKTATINRAGTDLIAANGSTVTSWTLNAGDDVTLTCVQAGYWFATGSSAIGSSSGFTASLTSSGYQKLPNGLIIQWGSGTTNSSGQLAVTLPITFPHGWFGGVATCQQAASYVCSVNSLTTTNITVTMYSSSTGAAVGSGGSIVWYALGY